MLHSILFLMGFNGTRLRYHENMELIVIFLNCDRHNPAISLENHIVSVGTMPVRVHGRLGDTRIRSPLHNRRDFDLNNPESLDEIEFYLKKMIDKCEPRKRRYN